MRSHRPRILYLSHIDWRWIKQRPQFIAEGLAERYDVEVAYRRLWRRGELVREPSSLTTHGIHRLPLRRLGPSAAASRVFERARIARLVAARPPDIVWLCFPSFYETLPAGLRARARLVYDCMDDASAFVFPHERERVARAERALVGEADLLLASSEALATDLSRRGAEAERLRVVRNAFGGEILPPAGDAAQRAGDAPLRAGYAGTIAPWLDWTALLGALEAIPQLEIHLLGPLEHDLTLPAHPRLFRRPPVPHAEVAGIARSWDVLLLPFVRSPLIDRVDPVKLYEYVNFDRPIVATRYPEIARFEPFADFFGSIEELVTHLRAHLEARRPKASAVAREAFLAANGWGARLESIRGALASLG